MNSRQIFYYLLHGYNLISERMAFMKSKTFSAASRPLIILLVGFVLAVAGVAAADAPVAKVAPASPSALGATACPAAASLPGAPENLDLLFTPEPDEQTSCSAEVTCWGGDVISCTGQTICTVDCGSVLCDHVSHECTCNVSFCSGWETAYCNCRSCGGTHQHCFQCWCLNGGVNC